MEATGPHPHRHVRFSPLQEQFADPEPILAEIRELVLTGDFTLGKPVREFEAMFAEWYGVRHVIGVGSGTDSIKLPLKALGVGHGDEVITTANTFYATVGAIAEVGASPVFVDCNDEFCTDAELIEAAITPRTKAIVPVHLAGYMADMPRILEIAARHGLPVVEDACQCVAGELASRKAGTWGNAGCFSMHPLKLINVWGDAGIIVTNDDALADRLRLLRNHGLVNRDEMAILGYNTRLDSLQAVVGKWFVRQLSGWLDRRIANAAVLDAGLSDLPGIHLPSRAGDRRLVYHLYMTEVDDRDALLAHCQAHGVEAKIHYPIPLYLQEGLRHLGHAPGDFPVSDRQAARLISFPLDEHLERPDLDHIVATVRRFHGA